MLYNFCPASPEDGERIFQLVLERIAWMDARGLHGWNDTGYLERYPLAYFREAGRQGQLYLLLTPEGEAAGGVVLLEEDRRWDGYPSPPAFYIHNLVASVHRKGAGRAILQAVEALARERGKTHSRLDCGRDNPALNRFYESQGYVPAGECTDGPYRGILRETRLSVS